MTKYLPAFACEAALDVACGDEGGTPSPMSQPTPTTMPTTNPPPPDTSLRTYDADDPNIQYTGRIDSSNPKLSSSPRTGRQSRSDPLPLPARPAHRI
jgi:hypothetical protein